MKWTIPAKNNYREPSKFPYKPLLIIIALIFIFFIGYNILTLPQDKNFKEQLFHNGIIIPMMISFFIWTFTASALRIFFFDYHFSEYLTRYGMYEWKNWAIETLILLNYSSITPVPDLALKMQKLEGEAPISPNTPLIIKTSSDSVDESRLQKVMAQLLEPLKDSLVRGYYPFNTWLYVKGADESVCSELRNLFEILGLDKSRTGEIHFMDKCPDYGLINKWIDEGTWQNRLLVVIELHDEEHKDFFENASAFIFTADELLKNDDAPLYVLRTMDSNLYHLDKSGSAYLSAQQVQNEKIKRFWSSSLDKQAKFILFSEIDNAKTGVMADSRYELELVTGQSTDVQQWLILALAADAAKYGQGHQLIASSDSQKTHMGLVTTKYPGRWGEPYMFDPALYTLFTVGFLICPAAILLLTVIPEKAFSEMPILGWGLLFVGVVIGACIVSLFNSRFKNIQIEMGINYPR
ncbi:hypothetical protein GJV04_08505 [Enterobacteriaceae bacterium RIT714]|nr:hypothetical protein [Enterobacteriaceae bacterium RIT714]